MIKGLENKPYEKWLKELASLAPEKSGGGGREFLLGGLTSSPLSSPAGPPVILLRDPEGGSPILEGSNVTLECLSEEEEGAGLSFQKYDQRRRAWLPLPAQPGGVSVRQESGRLVLSIRGAQDGHRGAYRCLATGSPASAQFDLRVEYLHSIFLSRRGTSCGTVGDSEPFREGEDLKLSCLAKASQEPLYEWSREGQDWVVASSLLVIRRAGREHAGTYTCRARHPSLAQLQKSCSLRMVLSKGGPGWAAEHALALAVAVPTALLLLLLTAFSLLIVTRHRAAVKAKALREEGLGQRSPIYKGSLESVPSTAGDTQPLVM
ncbi:sialic acid-binding Ig-like lectin 10 [Anolis sagrei]|uniref:sialic acid-binding Ig-like lectin 10 n=1 Tax=Anolis sagrei TaxID=38937 RepID=UPI0035209615